MTEAAKSTGRVRRRPFSVRKAVGFLHLWVGVIFSIPFAAIGLSGSLWMLVRDAPARIQAAPPLEHSIAEIIAAASPLARPGTRVVAFEAPSQGKPAGVRFAEARGQAEEGARGDRRGQSGRPQDGANRSRDNRASDAAATGTATSNLPAERPAGPPGFGTRVTVEPRDLSPALVPQSSNSFGRLMHDIHGHLFIDDFGRQFVGWLGVFMTGLGLTGIVLWWPRRGQWKRAFNIKLSGGLLRAVHDLHRVFGITTLIVFIIVCVSGVYIVFPQIVVKMVGAATPVDNRTSTGNVVTPVDGEKPLDVDAVVSIAQNQLPGSVLRTLNIPASTRQPYRLSFARIGEFTGAPLVMITVDQWAKRIVEIRDPAAYAANDKFIAWQRALHSGAGIGRAWWVLVFISGLLPLLFSVTGVTMWWIRRQLRRRAQVSL